MRVSSFVLIFLFSCRLAYPILSGNVGNPVLFQKGVITAGDTWWGLRLGYMGDWVYSQKYRQEFCIGECTTTATTMQMYTNAGVITWSILGRLELYGLLGASRMQIDEEAFSKTRFGWGVGAKCVALKWGYLLVGFDGKYYESSQKPLYFVCDNLAYNLVSPYALLYKEWQGGIGISLDFGVFSPYANATYIHSRIGPNPPVALVRVPMMDLDVDIHSTSVVSSQKWGLAVGATLIDSKCATLSFEWRGINQNSLDVTGEIRF